ncbi:hypothetical protein SCMC78_04600 [Streptomyces sp. CMC78]|uniref:Uncharacterized protein n=1 Tax=Streptomyces sp. CMC78 TaxID=3231512 RepID=A0AB33K657_9ACTN
MGSGGYKISGSAVINTREVTAEKVGLIVMDVVAAGHDVDVEPEASKQNEGMLTAMIRIHLSGDSSLELLRDLKQKYRDYL